MITSRRKRGEGGGDTGGAGGGQVVDEVAAKWEGDVAELGEAAVGVAVVDDPVLAIMAVRGSPQQQLCRVYPKGK